MAKKTLKLNPMQVQSAKAKEAEYSLSDGAGLYLRVKVNGTKAWIFNYTQPITKKRRNTSLGLYPEVGLADARRQADDMRELLKSNTDPIIHKQAVLQNEQIQLALTFKTVANEWLELRRTKLAATTFKKILRYFEKDVFPNIGHYPIRDVSATVGISVINAISGRGSQEIARKISRAMNQVMVFAVNTGRIKHNPLAGIKEVIPQTKQVHRPTLEPHELPELMQTLAYSGAKITTRCLIEFQLHTMTRPREAAQVKWSEIDIQNMLWTIPEERMKMRKAHIIPVTPQVVKLLEIVKPLSGNRDYVFASHNKPNHPVNSQTANKALRDMGFAGRLVAHGLRALASTTLNEHGFDDDVIEAALAHDDKNKIRKAYNRAKYLEKRRVMLQWWSDRIEQAKTGKVDQPTGTKNLRLINQ